MATLTELLVTLGVDPSDIDPGMDEGTKKVEAGAGKMLAAATVAAAGIGAAIGIGISTAIEMEAATDKVAAGLGATAEESERLGSVAGQLYADAYGDSLETVNGALGSVMKNMDGMRGASEDALEDVGAKVLDLATVFDEDFNAVTRSAGQLMKTGLAKDADEALDLITKGMTGGLNKADDLLDTLNEYPVQFEQLGLTGAQSLGLISQGLADGARDSDVVADSLKEFLLIAQSGSEASVKAFDDLGMSGDKMAKVFSKGGPEAAAALDDVLDKLRDVKDPADQSALAVALFGTKAEDMQDALYALDPSEAVDTMGQVEGAADTMGTTLNDNAQTNITSFGRTLQTAFVSILGDQVIPAITAASAWLSSNLGPAITAVGDYIGGTLIPGLISFATWIDQNSTAITVVAGIIVGYFLPAIIAWGVQSTIAGVKAVAAWVSSGASAMWSGITQAGAHWAAMAGWIKGAAVAVAQGARIAAVWVAQQAKAVWATGIIVAQWAAQQAKAIWAGIIIAAEFAKQIALWVAAQAKAVWATGIIIAQWAAQKAAALINTAITVASIIGGWIAMAAASFAGAIAMAAAWFIALGPVGWVIAAIVALVILIVVFWDDIKAATVKIFTAVWEFIQGAFDFVMNIIHSVIDWVKSNWPLLLAIITGPFGLAIYFIVKFKDDIINAVKYAVQWVTDKFGDLVDFVTGLPSKIASAASGMFNGIKDAFRGALNWLIDKWNGLELSIPEIEVLGVKIGGFTLSTPDIPQFANGAYVKARPGRGILANIGEGIHDEYVTPAPEMERTLRDVYKAGQEGRGSGGNTINVNVTTLEKGWPTADGMLEEFAARGWT